MQRGCGSTRVPAGGQPSALLPTAQGARGHPGAGPEPLLGRATGPGPGSAQQPGAHGGLRAGEATDSGVGSPHAASNRGIFVCTAAVTFLRHAAARVHSLQQLGWGEGAPAAPHRCCSPRGCWAGRRPLLLVALACAAPEGATPILRPARPLGGAVSPGPAPGSCTTPAAVPGPTTATCVPQFPHPDGARAATCGSSLLAQEPADEQTQHGMT